MLHIFHKWSEWKNRWGNKDPVEFDSEKSRHCTVCKVEQIAYGKRIVKLYGFEMNSENRQNRRWFL
jgi:hypothetical protein